MEPLRIVALDGDETGQELLEQSLRVPRLRGPWRRGGGRALRPLAREQARDQQRGLRRSGQAHGRDGPGPEGGDDHARGRRRRRQPQPHPARGDRRQGHRPHRPAHPGRDARRGRPPPHLGLPDGRWRRLRRRAVARGRGRDRGGASHRADRPRRLHGGGRVLVPRGGADRRARLWRAEVDGEPRLRGDAEGGDGRGGRAPPRHRLPAGPDRRDARGPRLGRRDGAAGHPLPQPRRRPPLRPRAPPLRLDRGRRVGAARARRGPRAVGRDGRGAAWNGARACSARTSRIRWR